MLAGLISLSASAATGLWRGIPVPGALDEFSYLLAADTYAHGRLTNPPHPNWEHFESIHLLPQPTLMSKYPPGQALVLAAGQVATGVPIAGVWLSVGLAAAAICWMLQAWVPVRWACFGGICLGLRLSVNYWGQSYWGGAVATIGGSLVFGAAVRLEQKLDWRTSLALGTGIVILSMTRPYEGLMATMVAAAGWLYARWQQADARFINFLSSLNFEGIRTFFLQGALPAALLVIPAGFWLAYNNFVVTGHWKTLPYQAHDVIYAACPTFLFQKVRAIPSYHHKDMENYYVKWDRERFLRKRPFFGFNASMFTKVWTFLKFFVGPLFAIPIGLAVWRFSDRGVKAAAVALVVALLAISQTLYLHPHYLAPFTGFVVLIAVQGWRMMNVWGHTGRQLAIATCAAAIVAPLLTSVVCPNHTSTRRSEVLAALLKHPGKHLVFVKQGDDQSCHEGWIYNEANLGDAQVVWARSINQFADARLCQSFGDRTVWSLYVDHDNCELNADYRPRNRTRTFDVAAKP